MSNLTLSVEDDVLRRARMRALAQGTSVNALVREYLGEFAGEGPAAEGARGFLALASRASASSGAAGRTWTRDDVHGR